MTKCINCKKDFTSKDKLFPTIERVGVINLDDTGIVKATYYQFYKCSSCATNKR